MTVTLPPAREVARHEAHHAAALCLQGMIPKRVRIDWSKENEAGSMTIDWADEGPDPRDGRARADRDHARRDDRGL
jgi:hypothetical protein